MSKRWTLEDIQRLQSQGNVHVPELVKNSAKPENNSKTPVNYSTEPQKNATTAKEAYQALGRMKGGKMNKTEERYAREVLDIRKNAGEVKEYWFEAINLRLADRCFYETDFLVMLATGELEVHEVKGYWTDDALVKIKVAAEIFPFRFVAMQHKKGEWKKRDF